MRLYLKEIIAFSVQTRGVSGDAKRSGHRIFQKCGVGLVKLLVVVAEDNPVRHTEFVKGVEKDPVVLKSRLGIDLVASQHDQVWLFRCDGVPDVLPDKRSCLIGRN